MKEKRKILNARVSIRKQDPINVSDVCQRHLPALLAALKKNVFLEINSFAPGLIIRGNASQIQLLLTKLVMNAMEAMSEAGGIVCLNINAVSSADIPGINRFPVDYELHDVVYACMEVVDTGCGIAATDIENLFDPILSSKCVSRGIGLAVVSRILRAHSGSIAVESQPGKGTTFRVFLPTLTKVTPLKRVHVSPAKQSGLILVVEDNPAVLNSFELVLMLFGYTVLIAKDGVEAVEVFKRHQDEIDCVLCDLCMPRMDGWATMAALRKLSSKLPVILTSGYNESDVMVGRAHSELPQAFLSKPFDLQKLSETLTNVLRNAKANG